MLGVVKDVVPEPPAKTVPPVAAPYQSIVSPAAGVAERVTVPVPHLEAPFPVGGLGIGFIVAVTGVLVDKTHPVVVFLACA